MTFDILPQVDTTETEVFDSETAALYIADGITSGNIVDLHSCVEYLNTYSTTPINGSMCEGLLKNAIKVLKQQLIDGDVGSLIFDNLIEYGEWNNFTIVRDGTNWYLYLNGIKQADEAITTANNLTFKIIGNGRGGTDVSFLSFDNFMKIDTILDATEAQLLYNSTKHAYGVQPAERSFSHDVGAVLGTPDNAVFCTDMHTKNADGTLIDLSGNNLHLTTGNVGRDSGYFKDAVRFVSSGSVAYNDADFDNGTNHFSITTLVRVNNSGTATVFNGRNAAAGLQADGSGYSLGIKDKTYILLHWYKDIETTHAIQGTSSTIAFDFSKYTLITSIIDTDANTIKFYTNGVLTDSFDIESPVIDYYCVRLGNFNSSTYPLLALDGDVAFVQLNNSSKDEAAFFNRLAALPLYSLDCNKLPANTTTFTTGEFLPNSSIHVNSGEFQIISDAGYNQIKCISTGSLRLLPAWEWDGDEYLTVTVDGTKYSDTGSITQGTVTASLEQGSTLITVDMVAGDTIDSIDIQFREPVDE